MENNNEFNKKSLIQTLKNEISTPNNFQKIRGNNNWIIGLLWFFCWITSFSYCSYTIFEGFTEYFKYDVTVSIKKVQDLPATFPAVTICNINPFYEDYALEFIGEHIPKIKCFDQNFADMNLLFECLDIDETDDLNEIIDSLNKQIKRVMATKNLTEDEKFYYTFDLEHDMLSVCEFNSQYCDAKNFTKFWSHEFGSCYTLNQGNGNTSLLKSSSPGASHGLHLEMIVVPRRRPLKFTYRTGLYLVVHNQSDQPFALKSGINIQTGTETYVNIKREYSNKLASPYSDCLVDLNSENEYAKVLFRYFAELNVTYYDQTFCYDVCYQDKLINKCGCLDVFTPTIRNSSYCANDSEVACLNQFDKFFSTTDLRSFCESACPEKCNTVKYILDASSKASFPTTYYLNAIATVQPYWFSKSRNFTQTELIEFARQGYLRVRINYGDLYYTSIDERAAITSNDLFGKLGGQLGLFLGLNLLSLMEILQFSINLISIYINFLKNSNNIMPFSINVKNNKITQLESVKSHKTQKRFYNW